MTVNPTATTGGVLIEMAKHGIEGIYYRLAPKANFYLRCLLFTSIIALVTIPTLFLLKVVTGQVVYGYLVALLGVIFVVVLGFLWSPLSLFVGLLLDEKHNARAVGEKYVRLVAMFIFFDLIASLLVSEISLQHNLRLVPTFLIAGTAMIIGRILSGGWNSIKFYTVISTLLVIKIFAWCLFPQAGSAIDEWWGNLDGKIAQDIKAQAEIPSNDSRWSSPSASNVITVTIPPNNQLSQVVHLPGNNKNFNWTTPGNVEFVLPNGRVIKVANGNTTFKLGTINDFRLRGDPGQATFTII